MMKRFLSLFLVALIWITGAGAAHAAKDKITLRVGFETPRSDSQYVGTEFMKKYVEEKSGGRIEMRLFPGSMLGSGQDMLAQMRSGTLDIFMSGAGYFATLAGKLNILDIPFLLTSTQQVDTLLEGRFGRMLLDELEPYDMKGLAFWENGFRCLTNFRNPIRNADDVKGLKLRLPGYPMFITAWEILGTNPVPLPLAELYTALETKAVEGQDHPLNVTYSAKLYEVQKYVSVSNHAYTALIMAMNRARFESLPADLQQILLDGALEAGRYQKKFVRENIEKMLAEMADYGCEIVTADQMDMQSFSDVLGNSIRDMYVKEYGGDTGSAWLKEIDEWNKP